VGLSFIGRIPFALQTREKIDKYVVNLGSNGIDGITKEINIYLGLMTSEEREEFIEWVIQSYGKLYPGETFLSLIY
jgi:hypothetical protein